MKIYNITIEQLNKALETINKKYDNNIIWNQSPEAINNKGTAYRFTIRVKDSKKSGARRGQTGRRMINACWHVHGDLFDTIFEIAPQAKIRSGNELIITIDNGNWQDRNIGSMMRPLYHSEACECK